MHGSLLSWRRYRYLYWSLILCALSIVLYASQGLNRAQPPNGGTWQGYVLGTLGAVLVIWLSLLGVRKRRYSSRLGTVQGWTSAHVYIGLALLLIATLHCAAQFGANVHTLAYMLMCVVIATGIYGLYVYMHLPERMAKNHGGIDKGRWLQELTLVDDRIRGIATACDARIQAMVLSALELTRLGGGAIAQLGGRDRCRVRVESEAGVTSCSNREQNVVIDELSRRIPVADSQGEAEALNDLLELFGRRQVILRLLQRDIQFRALLQIWLYIHIPMTIALLVALVVHIVAVFVYW